METLSYLDLFLGAFLNVIYCILIIRKIFNIKIIKGKCQKLLIVAVIALGIAIVNIINKNVFKALFAIPLLALCIHKIFEIRISKSIYYTMVSSFYVLIGEIFAMLIMSMLNINYAFLTTNLLGKTMGNIIAIIATTPLLYIKFICKIFIRIDNKTINTKTIVIFFVSSLIIGSAFIFKSTINIENLISSIMNVIIFTVFIVLVYFSYIENRKLSKISDEYNSLFNYLDKYEKQLNEKRKLIHDFKNQLIVINSYADNNKKLKEYLKDIIEEHKNIKETKIVKNINKLPNGLKGLLYYKLSQIEDEIKVSLNVDSRFNIFDKLNSKDNKNILKIIGILVDNAIESSIHTEEKYILIDISINKEMFEMYMINSCKDNFEKNKIMDLGFSTKGKDRGYGLSLVKDIIRNDDRYSIDLNTNKNEFITDFKINFN